MKLKRLLENRYQGDFHTRAAVAASRHAHLSPEDIIHVRKMHHANHDVHSILKSMPHIKMTPLSFITHVKRNYAIKLRAGVKKGRAHAGDKTGVPHNHGGMSDDSNRKNAWHGNYDSRKARKNAWSNRNWNKKT